MGNARSSVPVKFVFHERLSGIAAWTVRVARVSRFLNKREVHEIPGGGQWYDEHPYQHGREAYVPWAARVAGLRGKVYWFVRAVGWEGTGAQVVHLD